MMVRFFSAMRLEMRGMHEVAYLLAGFALLSQLLALLRDRILAAHFGAGHILDLYYAGFRIPDLLFATVASLLSLYALLPVLSRLEEEGEGLAVSFLRDALLVFFIGMAVVAAVVWFFVPQLVALTAPGLASDPSSHADLIRLVRILLLQPILLGASNTLAALTQLRHRFVLYSVSPLLYNLGIIFGVMVLYPRVGIAGLGWGVVLGALMHVLVQVPFFLSEKSPVRMPFKFALARVKEVLTLSVPRTLALSAGQISLLAIIAIASLLAPGSIAVFTFAFNLQAVPLTIIGVSYSVAAFPTLARLYAQGRQVEFASHIEAALRHMLFWAIPATVFIIVLRAQLVRVILGAGAFDWTATRLTAAALALFVISLAAQSVSLLVARAYYAAGNTKKPLYFGAINVVVSVGSALLLVVFFHQSAFLRAFIESILRVADIPGTSVLMLALGYALGSIVGFAASFSFFVKDFGLAGRRLLNLGFQSFSASVIGAAFTYGILYFTGVAGTINTTLGLVVQGVGAGLSGLIVTGIMLWLLKNEE
ncbi:MAG: lipid II flippase MurJ, partial [bacterium]|nr:lipid II flippase MurJ [bacterium]